MHSSKYLQSLAKAVVFHCVRNTVIEDWHAEGRISQAEMKEFIKEVVDRQYTTMLNLSDPEFADEFFRFASETEQQWDKPKFDVEFDQAIRNMSRRHAASDLVPTDQ
ncbi:hypothetical protein O9X98_06440 [Agrobacterium salinitolerans]|nr:hypothetical protein [Agrobacterium salinitolerans]